MLSPDQENWVSHLSNDDHVAIVPCDPAATAKFEKVKGLIQSALGQDMPVEHWGATSLGISGQDEIDVYIPVEPSRFYDLVEFLSALFGNPRSHYPLRRARFVTEVEGKHIDVFAINEDSSDWTDGVKFNDYLRSNPQALDAYRKLKEAGNGLSTQEYYRRKLSFINDILGEVRRDIG